MLHHIRAAVDMTCMVSFGLRQSSAVHGTKLSCISNMILTGDTCFFVSEDVSSSEVFLKHFPWQLGLFTGRLVSACVDPNSGGQKRKLSQSELDTITQNRQEAMAIRQKKMQGSLYSFHIQNLSVKVLAHAERDVCRGGVRRSFPPSYTGDLGFSSSFVHRFGTRPTWGWSSRLFGIFVIVVQTTNKRGEDSPRRGLTSKEKCRLSWPSFRGYTLYYV